MKKQFLDFTKVHYFQTQRGFAPELRMRHNKGAQFRSGGSEEDDDDDEEEGEKKLMKRISAIIKKQIGTRASKEDVDKIIEQFRSFNVVTNEKGKEEEKLFPIEALREMADEKTGVMAKLVEQGLEIQELKNKAEKAVKAMDIRSQVIAWRDANKDLIAKPGERQKKVEFPELVLDLRAAGTMHVSNVNAGGSPYIGRIEVEAGINPILRFDNTFWDYIRKGRTGSPTYVWVNMVNPDGEAAFIGPGVAKPGVDFELSAETSVAKKIADSSKAGTEILQDIDGMVDLIEGELKAKVYIKLNETLMANSAGSSTVPAGIRYYAQDIAGGSFSTAFASLKTETPNNYDAIRSAVAALRSGKLRGKITVFVNPVDVANMDMAKANSSGVYILPAFTTADGRRIAGADVVEDQNITIGSFLAAFLDYYVIKIYQDLVVMWGWENDDFTKNLVTAIGEMRLHQYVNSIHTGFAFYDSFDDVKAEIEQV